MFVRGHVVPLFSCLFVDCMFHGFCFVFPIRLILLVFNTNVLCVLSVVVYMYLWFISHMSFFNDIRYYMYLSIRGLSVKFVDYLNKI